MKKVFVLVFVIIILVTMGAAVYGDDTDGKPDALTSPVLTAEPTEPTPVGSVFGSPVDTPDQVAAPGPPDWGELWRYPIDLLRWSN